MSKETLPKFEDWSAPWETATGETEIDKGRLKKYLYGLLSDKERLQASVTEVTGERDKLKAEADEKAREGETESDRLKRENKELQDKLAAAGAESTETLKLRIALEKGLTPTQVKRLVGTTEEELKADADELLASWGGSGKGSEEDGDKPPRRTPRKLTNNGDPDPDGDDDVDVSAALDRIPRL